MSILLYCLCCAGLINSACPEKIKEFEEIKAMGKKKQNCCKPRQKKSKNRLSSLPEVTLELQNLVLGVEPESYSSCSTSISSKVVIPENINAINDNVMDKHSPHVELSVREADSNATRSCHPANHVPAENKIIDLLSPPQAPSRNVYTFQEGNSQNIIIQIDSSDSESDVSLEHVSLEHQKKARELRLFLASIRDDIS